MRGSGWKRRLFAFALCVVLTAVSFVGLTEENTEGNSEQVEHIHSWSPQQTVKPTCTEDGYTLYACDTCEATEKRDIAKATGHQWDEGKPFKEICEEEGFTLFTCIVCGEGERRNVVPPLGHNWKPTAVYLPSCDTVGYTEYTCETCGGTKADDQVLPLGHKWSEWTVETKPTCTVDGLETRKCEECGEIEKNVLPAGHTWNEKDVCTACEKSAAARIGDVKYASLQEAVDVVKKDQIIVLLANGECLLKENQTVRIDVNGFAAEVSVPKDCALVHEDETDIYTALKAYAETDGVEYTTLREAVAAAQPGGVVTVLADEIGEGITVDKNLTIDFAGFTYTARDPGGEKQSPDEPSKGAAIELNEGIEVELKNGGVRGSGNAKYIIQDNSDKLTLRSMTLNALLNANLKYALSINRGETVLTGATTISGGVGQWAIDLWMTQQEAGTEYVNVTLDEKMTGVVAGYVRIYPDSQLEIKVSESSGKKDYQLVPKGTDEDSGCPYYCIAVVITPTPSPTPKPTATPSPTPTSTSSGGGGGGGSSSDSSTEESDLEEEEEEEASQPVEGQGIVDRSLGMMRSIAGFVTGGAYEN